MAAPPPSQQSAPSLSSASVVVYLRKPAPRFLPRRKRSGRNIGKRSNSYPRSAISAVRLDRLDGLSGLVHQVQGVCPLQLVVSCHGQLVTSNCDKEFPFH